MLGWRLLPVLPRETQEKLLMLGLGIQQFWPTYTEYVMNLRLTFSPPKFGQEEMNCKHKWRFCAVESAEEVSQISIDISVSDGLADTL